MYCGITLKDVILVVVAELSDNNRSGMKSFGKFGR